MSKKNSNNINKSTVSSGNKFSDDSVINEMDVLPNTKSIKLPIKLDINFDPLIGYVNSEITLAMSPDSTGLFTIGNNIDKYTGISKEETKEVVESGNETPDDAVVYGMCNVMNNGNDIFFWTNGTRLAGASDKSGVMSAINEQLSHECLHLTRLILNKHILTKKSINNWAESDWLSIGDNKDDIQEESFATAVGLVVEQVIPEFIKMASEYIPELKDNKLPLAQNGLDFQSRLNQFLKPSTFSPNILGRSSGRSNFGYEYKAGPFTQSTMFSSDRRLAPVDKFTFASDNPTNTQLSLNTGLNYKDKYGFKGAASYANTTAKNDPNAKFNIGYNRKGLTADYNYNYNKENPSYNLGAGYRGQGVTADFKMSKDKYNISFDNKGNVVKTPIKTPTYNTNVGYELDGVSGKFGFTGNKETPKYTFGVGYDKKGVTGEFTATKDQKKPFVYNANLGYNKDGFSTGLEFSGNKENPNYTYRVKYEPEKQGFTTDSNLEFTKGNIDATTGLGYKNKNINTGLTYKTSIDRESESQQNSLGANFGYRNKNFNTGVNYERKFATEENPASNKIGVNVGYRNKSGIGVNAGVDYKTLSEDQKKLEKASPFEFRAGVTYTPQRKRQQTPTKKFTFSKEDVKKEPIDIKDLPDFKKRFGGQHIYHDLFKQGGTVINESDIIAQGGLYIQPTAQDSSDVYNKSKELQDYFKNKGYQSQGTTKLPYNDSNIFKRELDRLYGQFINQQSTNYPTSTGGSTSSKLDPKYYRKPTNPNKPTIIEQRESQFGTLDTRAPFGYYDTRIVPKEMSSYKNVNMKDPLRGDEVNIPIYDVSVKPYAMRTPAEQAEVERKYGKPKPIVKPVFKDQQEADYPKSNSKAETIELPDYSKYMNLTPQDVLDKYSFDEYSKAFGLDPVTMRKQISKNIKWDKISNLGEFDTEKFLTRKLYDYIQDNPPKAQKGKPIPTVPAVDDYVAGMRGMMKARMAMDSHFGNPSAKRMTSVSPKEYTFTGNEYDYDWDMPVGVPAGEKGTHFMAGMDNYAVPFIQEGSNGNLYFNERPSKKDREAMRFETPEEARYFSEHYKEIAPMMNKYKSGGIIHESNVLPIAQKGFRLPTGEYVSEPVIVTAPKMSMYEQRVKAAGKDSDRYRNLGRDVASLFSNAAEVTGVPGALRFANDPKKNLSGALNTIDNFILSGSQSMPTGVIQQTPYKEEDTQAFFNTLDATGLLTAGLSGAKQPIQKGLQETSKLLNKYDPKVLSYLNDVYQTSKINKKLSLPQYQDIYRWQPDKTPDWLIESGKNTLTPEQQALTGAWYSKNPELGFYLRTRHGSGTLLHSKLPEYKIAELEKNMPSSAKGMSGKIATKKTAEDFYPGELIVPKEYRNISSKPIRFDVNPSDYLYKSDDWKKEIDNIVSEYGDDIIDKDNTLYKMFYDKHLNKFLKEIAKEKHNKKFLNKIPSKYVPFKSGGLIHESSVLPKAQVGLNQQRKYGLSKTDQENILKEAERTKYQLTKPSGFMTKNPNWYKNPDLLEENITEFFDPTGITSHDDAYRAYKEWQSSSNKLPNANQALDMFGAVPALGKFGKLKYLSNYYDLTRGGNNIINLTKPIYKYLPWQKILNFEDTVEDLSNDNIRPTKQHGGIIHESDVIKAQKGKNVTIDGKVYNTSSPEYKKLYYDNSVASIDEEGLPNMYYPEVEVTAKRDRVADAVRKGTGKFARGVMSGANYASEIMGTPVALALEALSGRGDFQSALPDIDRSNKMFGLPYSKENLPSNEQLSPSSALGITNPYISIPIDLAADYATGRILSNPKKYIKGIKPVPFDSPSHVYNTDINKPVQRYETYRWSEKNPETNWYDVYEKEFPIDLIPTRDPISDPYQKIKMKSILRRDEGFTWPITDYLRTKKILPKEQWDISDVLSDPNTGLLQDGNTRYWLNKRYNPSFGLGDNKYKIENRISNLRKNNFEDLKPLYSSDEPIKSQWINKKSGGIIHESDIVKAQIGKYIPSWLNPYNYNVTDYSKYKTKDEAYAAARKAGEKEFMWNKNRYSTKMAGTPEEQLKWSGITDERTTSKSNIPGVNIAKERLEKNLVPYGYKDAFGRVYDAIINNKSRPFVGEDNTRYKLEDVSPERKDAYKLYMNKPQQNNTFGISKYKPSVTKEGDTDVYYKINNIGSTSGNPKIDDSYINYIYDISQENKGNNTGFADDIMAHHKIGLGKDDRGEYMSYYDNWDLNPYKLTNPITGKEITTNVGKPFEIYDRFYFKDYGDGTKKRMYYTDDELKSFSTDKKHKLFDTIALQKELYNRGYKLPKSIQKNEEGELFFDGVYGDETKAALEDWQKKNPNKLIGDGNKANQANKYPYNWSSNTQSVPTSKTQYSGKQSGGIINESDVIKYKSGGNHGGLDRWFAEKWVDVKTGKQCGRQEGEKRRSYPACRPSVRVTSKTPKTASELSSSEKEKFKRSKTSSQRINYQHKRNNK